MVSLTTQPEKFFCIQRGLAAFSSHQSSIDFYLLEDFLRPWIAMVISIGKYKYSPEKKYKSLDRIMISLPGNKVEFARNYEKNPGFPRKAAFLESLGSFKKP